MGKERKELEKLSEARHSELRRLKNFDVFGQTYYDVLHNLCHGVTRSVLDIWKSDDYKFF